MLLQVPDRVKRFVWYWCHVPRGTRVLLGTLLVGFLLLRGRRTLSNLACSVVEARRHVSNVSRFFSGNLEMVAAAYGRCVRRTLNRGVKIGRRRHFKRWVLVIDTTFQRKHSLNMPSLIMFKEKANGVPAGNHAFVFGLLLGPGGVRIPLPTRLFLTKQYVKTHNAGQSANNGESLVFCSQIDLAVELVEQARQLLPPECELWVVADNFFEGPKLDQACDPKKGICYVTSLDSGRIVNCSKRRGRKVRDVERALPDTAFERVALAEGRHPFDCLLRRETNRKRGRGRPRESVFQVAKRYLEISRLGKRNVFFSWKHRRFRRATKRAKAHLKMLITNRIDATTAEVVAVYGLRWQVELFFRELKSDLGLGHYQALTLQALQAHVCLALLAFLFLENYRLDLIRQADPQWIATHRVHAARTRQLVLLFEADARRQDLRGALNVPARRRSRWIELLQRIQPRRLHSKSA